MKLSVTLVSATLLLSGCLHRYQAFDIYFWTSGPAGKNYRLYLDHGYAGTVPALGRPPVRLDAETLHRHLPSGSYQVELTDDQGRTVYRERLKVLWSTRDKTISTEARESTGSSQVKIEGSVVVEEFRL